MDCVSIVSTEGECSPDYIQPPPRPGNCPALLLQSDDILCNSDSCHTDHSCVNRPTSKCCRTTCPDRLGGSMTGKTICLEGGRLCYLMAVLTGRTSDK